MSGSSGDRRRLWREDAVIFAAAGAWVGKQWSGLAFVGTGTPRGYVRQQPPNRRAGTPPLGSQLPYPGDVRLRVWLHQPIARRRRRDADPDDRTGTNDLGVRDHLDRT